MSHPPFNPDFAPSDYHLFRSLQNFLNGKSFSNNDVIKSQLAEFVCCQGPEILSARDHEDTRKMAKGHRTEWKIFDGLKFIFCIEKIEFYFTLRKRNYFFANPIYKFI